MLKGGGCLGIITRLHVRHPFDVGRGLLGPFWPVRGFTLGTGGKKQSFPSPYQSHISQIRGAGFAVKAPSDYTNEVGCQELGEACDCEFAKRRVSDLRRLTHQRSGKSERS